MDKVRESLPKDKLKHHLAAAQLIQDANSPLSVTQYTNGYSNLTYLLEIEAKTFVLRCPPKGAVKHGHDMSREYKVLSSLQKAYGLGPKPYIYVADSSIIGSTFYLMEKIDGIILTAREAHKRKLSPASFGIIADTWMRKFVDLHQVDYQAVGLADLGKPAGYVERQVRNWSKQYFKAATMDIPEATKLMEWMAEHQPNTEEHTFIHNDYKYDNVVFKNDSWQEITAVLDWEMCTLGDPLMDLGASVAYWMMPSDGPAAQFIPSPTLMKGNPSRTDIVQRYAELSGRNVDNFVFYYAFGLFKIAVIAQQIFFRYKAGLTKDEKFAQLDKACAIFCKMGWQAVQKNSFQNFM